MSATETLAALKEHLPLVHSGKARESFHVWKARSGTQGYRAIYPTDRISSDDFVLGFLMDGKGEILNAETVFWKLRAEIMGIQTDLIAYGPDVDVYLPPALRGNPELWKRLSIVEELEMVPGECIDRNVLSGSASRQYANPENNGVVYGHQLPPELQEGDWLETPLFTPTTKAKEGHDEPLTFDEFVERYPGIDEATHSVTRVLNEGTDRTGVAFYADHKVEFGRREGVGPYILCDEVGTPDSSRIWRVSDYKTRKPGTVPPPNDKDFIRERMKILGIKSFDPRVPEDRDAVRKFGIPGAFVEEAVRLYATTPALTTGMDLRALQKEVLGIGL